MAYQRIRSAEECRRALATGVPVQVGLYIDDSWAPPTDGMVGGFEPNGTGHSVAVVGESAESHRLVFVNSWGGDWGANGLGQMTTDYYDERVKEAWAAIPCPFAIDRRGLGIFDLGWRFPDLLGGQAFGFDVVDSDADERIGWAFLVQRNGFAELEEFFVRPRYRGRGHGRLIAQCVSYAAKRLEMPLRMWINPPDSHTVNEGAAASILNRLGLRLGASRNDWAPFLAE
jgi:GNAT superfamily N-acetyltransferase